MEMASGKRIQRNRANAVPHDLGDPESNPFVKVRKTRQVLSMIHSARPIVTLVANIIFCYFVLVDLKSGDGRTDMCENNNPYRPWLWVGRVDQLLHKL